MGNVGADEHYNPDTRWYRHRLEGCFSGIQNVLALKNVNGHFGGVGNQ